MRAYRERGRKKGSACRLPAIEGQTISAEQPSEPFEYLHRQIEKKT